MKQNTRDEGVEDSQFGLHVNFFAVENTFASHKSYSCKRSLRRISDSVSSNVPRNLQFFQSLAPFEMWNSSVFELLISRLRSASLVVARVLMRSNSAFNRLIQLRSSAYWESNPLLLVMSGVLTSLDCTRTDLNNSGLID